eukprot:CAMPEP_0174723436 /NCGR_PEP_ID=MMETSP1094-20130205/40925_1 /TAXON_ID=156173 /ORGANISM="Chrysochromulina brevifilum, Strain UTEX LB 985" /LENGTH=34 /DNA_ID= /DNA_START= /DNA_END= /DNA_ORIENTATION=
MTSLGDASKQCRGGGGGGGGGDDLGGPLARPSAY